jgi:hypothetical protein
MCGTTRRGGTTSKIPFENTVTGTDTPPHFLGYDLSLGYEFESIGVQTRRRTPNAGFVPRGNSAVLVFTERGFEDWSILTT